MSTEIIEHTSLLSELTETLQNLTEWALTPIAYSIANPQELMIGAFLLVTLAIHGVVFNRLARAWL